MCHLSATSARISRRVETQYPYGGGDDCEEYCSLESQEGLKRHEARRDGGERAEGGLESQEGLKQQDLPLWGATAFLQRLLSSAWVSSPPLHVFMFVNGL